MSKGKLKVINLMFSSPEPVRPSSSKMAHKHANAAGAESEPGSDFSVPVSSISALAGKFYTRDGLHRHLMSLGPATLSKMLLSQVQDDQLRPKPDTLRAVNMVPKQLVEQNPYAYCVYCHKEFDKRQNKGCKVKHFGELEEVDEAGDVRKWTCCGGRVSYVGYNPGFDADPLHKDRYCNRGRHWERSIGSEDRVRRWRELLRGGVSCVERGCGGESELVAGIERPSKRMRG